MAELLTGQVLFPGSDCMCFQNVTVYSGLVQWPLSFVLWPFQTGTTWQESSRFVALQMPSSWQRLSVNQWAIKLLVCFVIGVHLFSLSPISLPPTFPSPFSSLPSLPCSPTYFPLQGSWLCWISSILPKEGLLFIFCWCQSDCHWPTHSASLVRPWTETNSWASSHSPLPGQISRPWWWGIYMHRL